MPYLKLKEIDPNTGTNKLAHVTKKQKRAVFSHIQEPWNPEANGKVIEDGGRMYQILPTGWKRRKDLEQLEAMKLKVNKATDTNKEFTNGTDSITITEGK
jgi:hypothetical protein